MCGWWENWWDEIRFLLPFFFHLFWDWLICNLIVEINCELKKLLVGKWREVLGFLVLVFQICVGFILDLICCYFWMKFVSNFFFVVLGFICHYFSVKFLLFLSKFTAILKLNLLLFLGKFTIIFRLNLLPAMRKFSTLSDLFCCCF